MYLMVLHLPHVHNVLNSRYVCATLTGRVRSENVCVGTTKRVRREGVREDGHSADTQITTGSFGARTR